MDKKILFRASSVGKLLEDTKGSIITQKQLQEIDRLSAKSKLPKGITLNQQDTLNSLIAKRDKKPELGTGAKTYVRECWLRNEFGYDMPVVVPQLLKGLMNEQDGIKLLSLLDPVKEFRKKNEKRFTDDYFSGVPDIILKSENCIEDVKLPWTIKQFFDAEPINLYKCQVQVYMHLTGCKKAKIHYLMISTQPQLVLEECKRFYFKYGCDEDNEDYMEAERKIEAMHNVTSSEECVQNMARVKSLENRDVLNEKQGEELKSLKEWLSKRTYISIGNRIKTFEYDYDPELIKKLKKRIRMAREYYKTLKL
jgi:hypothetical protein